jgi:hypothetical protein
MLMAAVCSQIETNSVTRMNAPERLIGNDRHVLRNLPPGRDAISRAPAIGRSDHSNLSHRKVMLSAIGGPCQLHPESNRS